MDSKRPSSFICWPLSSCLPCLALSVFLSLPNQPFWNLSLHSAPQGLTFSFSHALPLFHPEYWRCPIDTAWLGPHPDSSCQVHLWQTHSMFLKADIYKGKYACLRSLDYLFRATEAELRNHLAFPNSLEREVKMLRAAVP